MLSEVQARLGLSRLSVLLASRTSLKTRACFQHMLHAKPGSRLACTDHRSTIGLLPSGRAHMGLPDLNLGGGATDSRHTLFPVDLSSPVTIVPSLFVVGVLVTQCQLGSATLCGSAFISALHSLRRVTSLPTHATNDRVLVAPLSVFFVSSRTGGGS